ncbi:MAG: reverse transcriptase domain-containing protein, partial [Dysosmobacter sp.]|nr:reverse transcriptase domain-containing protein [Dysosmobacter sp.]
PTITDRLVQQCILQILEPICEAKFHPHSFGFRPNRGCEHAIAAAYFKMQKQHLHYVVDIDIKGFFDNVNHGKLLKQMWSMGIRDKKLLSILSAMLKAEVAGVGFPEKGTPQGGIISPLLSNIVLNELDWWISDQWETFIPRREYSCKYPSLRKSNLKECYIVRYADDFKLFCRKRSDAVKLFEATKQWLKERLGLEISPEKSKIVNLKRHYSDFLGYQMKVHAKGKTPQGFPKYVVTSRMGEKAYHRIDQHVHDLVKELQHTIGTNREHRMVSRWNSYPGQAVPQTGMNGYSAAISIPKRAFSPILTAGGFPLPQMNPVISRRGLCWIIWKAFCYTMMAFCIGKTSPVRNTTVISEPAICGL